VTTIQLCDTARILIDPPNHELQILGTVAEKGPGGIVSKRTGQPVWKPAGHYSSLRAAAEAALTKVALSREGEMSIAALVDVLLATSERIATACKEAGR